jgi:hypothetical protein
MKPVDENCKFRAVVVAGILKPERKTKIIVMPAKPQ